MDNGCLREVLSRKIHTLNVEEEEYPTLKAGRQEERLVGRNI